MSKNLRIKVNGTQTDFTGVKEIDTGLLATSKRQRWVPKDEAAEYADLITWGGDTNGSYRAVPGADESVEYNADGTVAETVAADGFASFTANVSNFPPGYKGATFTRNDKYKIKNFSHDMYFEEFTVDVPSSLEQLTITERGIYNAAEMGSNGFASPVNVQVQNPLPAQPYQPIEITENGDYLASDRNGYGFDNITVAVPKRNKISKRWAEEVKQAVSSIYGLTEGEFVAGCVYGDYIYAIIQDCRYMLVIKDKPNDFAIGTIQMPRKFNRNDAVGAYPTMVVYDDEIHILGGYDGMEPNGGTSAHYILHLSTPSSGTFQELRSLTYTPSQVIVYKNSMYMLTAAGAIVKIGDDANADTVAVTLGIKTASICAHNGYIYIVGGMINTADNPNLAIKRWSPHYGIETVGAIDRMLIRPKLLIHNGKLRIMGTERGADQWNQGYYDFSFEEADWDDGWFVCESIWSREYSNGVPAAFNADKVIAVNYNDTIYIVGIPADDTGYVYCWGLEEEAV